MRENLLEFLAPRVETVTLGGQVVTVRQLGSAADTTALRDGADAIHKLIVRCTFDAEGKQVFADENIPALKAAAAEKLAPLVVAVCRVNGFDIQAEEKNSEAAPSSG